MLYQGLLLSCLLFLDFPSVSTSVEAEKERVVVQNGQFSLKDSEITLLINSTFEIIEDFENNSTEITNGANETSVDTSEELATTTNLPHPKDLKLVKKNSKPRYQRLRPASCRQFSIQEKYQLLERAGGRNQLFMAESPEEASKGFASLYPEVHERSLADDVQSEVDIDFCDSRCETIKSNLEKALQNRQQVSQAKAFRLQDDASAVVGEQLEIDEGDIDRSCYLDSFVPVGNCSAPGEGDTWTHEHLCSECRGIYLMSRKCFPTFFNTVRCNTQELGCIFDTFSDNAHGECTSQSLSFKVLRNKGDSDCEDWIVESIELPVACQCMLSKSSWLRSHPRKEL